MWFFGRAGGAAPVVAPEAPPRTRGTLWSVTGPAGYILGKLNLSSRVSTDARYSVGDEGFLGRLREPSGDRVSDDERFGRDEGFLGKPSSRTSHDERYSVSDDGYLGRLRENPGNRTSPSQERAGLDGFLKRDRTRHFYPALTEVPVPPVFGGSGDWILASGSWDDAGIWDDASVWKDAA